MRIAVASSGLDVASSFIQCDNFNYYTTISCQIVASQSIPEQGMSPEEYAQLMDNMDVSVFICNEISDTAKQAFIDHGIVVVDGKQGKALQVAEEYVQYVAEHIEDEDEDEE